MAVLFRLEVYKSTRKPVLLQEADVFFPGQADHLNFVGPVFVVDNTAKNKDLLELGRLICRLAGHLLQ